jgi:hypothetical protein
MTRMLMGLLEEAATPALPVELDEASPDDDPALLQAPTLSTRNDAASPLAARRGILITRSPLRYKLSFELQALLLV